MESENQQLNDARAQAAIDDARINARMTDILEGRAGKATKSKASAPTSPEWLKKKPIAKPAAKAEAPKPKGRAARKAGPKARPPKGSDESWQLAAEHVSKKQNED